MVKNYFLKISAGIIPSRLLASCHTFPEQRNSFQIV